MLIARSKRKENITEYLLYMWQIEDLIRACNLDIDTIQVKLIDGYDQPNEVKLEIREWYENLINMMRLENVSEHGHLQINKNVIIYLIDLHNRLMGSSKEGMYKMTYYKALPLIVELKAKSGKSETEEIETSLNFMYGLLLLRLQKKEISEETLEASKLISDFLRLLSEKYKKDKEEGLDL
jgi:hypothetical protein